MCTYVCIFIILYIHFRETCANIFKGKQQKIVVAICRDFYEVYEVKW